MWLYMIVAVVGTGVVSLFSVHSLTAFIVSVLGERKCLSTDSVNGCDWWPRSIMVSGLVAFLLWRPLNWLGLIAIPIGPLCTAFVAAIFLRYGQRRARKREFRVEGDRIVRVIDGAELKPTYLIESGGYYQTGPATGYCLYAIILKDSSGVLATNGYVSMEEDDEVCYRLVSGLSIPTLEAAFVVEAPDGSLRSVVLGSDWNDFLLGQKPPMPENDEQWWSRLVSPALGPHDIIPIDPHDLLNRLATVETASTTVESPRIKQDIEAMRTLAGCTGQIKAMRHDYLSFAFTEQKLGHRTAHRCEEGVWVAESRK